MIEILKKYLLETFCDGIGGLVFFRDEWWNFSLIADRVFESGYWVS